MTATRALFTLNESPAVKAAYEWLESQQLPMLESVKRWSLINSGSHNLVGLGVMQQELLKAFEALDCEYEIIPLPEGEYIAADGCVDKRKNANLLRFYKRPTANRRILLTGHYDTVFGVDHPFQDLNWIDDATLGGPGVADMKGGIIVILHALLALEQSPFAKAIGWEVLLSPDEETGSLASAPYLVQRASDFDLGLTYEPAMADGTLAGARKGSGNYTIVVLGRSAHAGREFDKGRNAVVALADIITKLAALSGQREGLTVNPAVISGVDVTNAVPDQAICRFNVRLEHGDDEDWLTGQLNDILKPWQAREGYEASLHGGINRPPKHLSEANLELMELIKVCGEAQKLKIGYVATGGCCEGNNLAAAGLPNVDTLGVRGGAIHSADEYLITESLAERSKLSALILMAISNGNFDSVMKIKSQDAENGV